MRALRRRRVLTLLTALACTSPTGERPPLDGTWLHRAAPDAAYLLRLRQKRDSVTGSITIEIVHGAATTTYSNQSVAGVFRAPEVTFSFVMPLPVAGIPPGTFTGRLVARDTIEGSYGAVNAQSPLALTFVRQR